MTYQQDVLDPRRSRRRTPVILLGMAVAAVAVTALVVGGSITTPQVKATPERSAAANVVGGLAVQTQAVTAPGSLTDAKHAAQAITVTAPKAKPAVVKAPAVKKSTAAKKAPAKATPSVKKVAPKKAAPKKVTAKKTAPKKAAPKKAAPKKTTAKKTASKSSSGKSTKTVKQYCASPNPVTASCGTGKAFLGAINKERAKLGIKPLKWSSSLASTATSWSKKMLKKDLKTKKLIDGLAHNPNRPGAENVAVVYSSAGYSSGTAVSRMHRNLVNSNGHCLNLMNPKYSTMGAGVAKSSNGKTWYATQNFR